jgi:transposase-like protein
MEQPDQLDRLFARAKHHRIPMAAICKRADVDPTTPSRWRRRKNGATLDRLNRLNDALEAIITEGPAPIEQKEAA